MSSTMRTLQRIVPSYDSPRGRAVDRGKVAEAAQETAEAGVPHAAQAAQAAEGRMEVRKGGAVFWDRPRQNSTGCLAASIWPSYRCVSVPATLGWRSTS